MKKIWKKHILNQLGISALEITMGAGLAIGLGAVVMKNMTNQSSQMLRNQQNLAIELNLKQVSDNFKSKTRCDRAVGGLTMNEVNNVNIDGTNTTLIPGGETTPPDETQTQGCNEPDMQSPRQAFPNCYDENGNFVGNSLGQTDGEDQTGINTNPPQSCNIEEHSAYLLNYNNLMTSYEACLADLNTNPTDTNNPPGGDDANTTEEDPRLAELNLDFASDMGSGLKLENMEMSVESGNGDVPLTMTFTYVKRDPRDSSKVYEVEKQIITDVTFVNGRIECPGYEREQIASAGLGAGCEMLTGDPNAFERPPAGAGECDLTQGISPDFIALFKDAACKSVSKGLGALDGSDICNRIDLAGDLRAENIEINNAGPDFIKIMDPAEQQRNRFDTDACAANNFLTTIPVGGDINPAANCDTPGWN